MRKTCKVEVRIPPGIEDGQGVRIPNEGEPGPDSAARGNLFVYVRVAPHPFLEREGSDLICRMPISFTQAALGAKVEVPTINGKVEMAIPRGTQHGQVLRLSGQGLPGIRSQRPGNLLVQVLVEIPKKLSKTQEQLLREFAETEDKAVLPESRSFLERLKSYISGANHNPKP
jgi:molecular chaperone DnaJ